MKKKSMFGALAGEKPVSMHEIVRGLKEDRKDADEAELEAALRVASAWEKYCSKKSVKPNFNEFVKMLLTSK